MDGMEKIVSKERREVKALDKLLELNSILLAIFGIGIFGSMRSLTKAVLKRQDEKKKEKESMNKALVAIMHSLIYSACATHLTVGFISLDDMDDLSYLFRAYKGLGGNGTGETIYLKVANLPNKKEKNETIKQSI